MFEKLFGTIYGTNEFYQLSFNDKVEVVKAGLIRYLPNFINVGSEITQYFLISVSKSFTRLHEEIYGLRNADWSGKGLRLTAQADRIYFKDGASDNQIQTRLERRFEILNKRGTPAGLVDDLQNLDLSLSADPQFYHNTQSGWIIDATYPETDLLAMLDGEKILQLNLSKDVVIGGAVVNVSKIGDHHYQYIQPIAEEIKKYLVPIDTQIIFE